MQGEASVKRREPSFLDWLPRPANSLGPPAEKPCLQLWEEENQATFKWKVWLPREAWTLRNQREPLETFRKGTMSPHYVDGESCIPLQRSPFLRKANLPERAKVEQQSLPHWANFAHPERVKHGNRFQHVIPWYAFWSGTIRWGPNHMPLVIFEWTLRHCLWPTQFPVRWKHSVHVLGTCASHMTIKEIDLQNLYWNLLWWWKQKIPRAENWSHI